MFGGFKYEKISKIVALMLMFSTLLLSLTACSNPTKDAEATVTRNFDELKSLDDEMKCMMNTLEMVV